MITLHRILGHCTQKIGGEWPVAPPLLLKYHFAPHDCQAIIPDAVQPLVFAFSNLLFMAARHFQDAPLNIITAKQDHSIIIEIQKEKQSMGSAKPLESSESTQTSNVGYSNPAISNVRPSAPYEKGEMSLVPTYTEKHSICMPKPYFTGVSPSIIGPLAPHFNALNTQGAALAYVHIEGCDYKERGQKQLGRYKGAVHGMPKSLLKPLSEHDMTRMALENIREKTDKEIRSMDIQQKTLLPQGSSKKQCGPLGGDFFQLGQSSFHDFFGSLPYIDPFDPLQEARLQAMKIDAIIRQNNTFYQLIIPDDQFLQIASPPGSKML